MKPLNQLINGFLGLVALLAIVEYLPVPRKTEFWDGTYDTGHILIFGLGVVMCLTIARAVGGGYRKRWQYLAACSAALLLGLVLELWQSTRGRTAEWIDVFNDIVGIVVFCAGYAMFDNRLPTPRPWWLKRTRLAAIIVVAMLVGLVPFLQTVNLYRVRHGILPSLMDWQQPWYGRFYYVRSGRFEVVDAPANWQGSATPHARLGRLVLDGQDRHPGFIFREPHSDWSAYRALEIDVQCDGDQEVPFFLRVDDFGHNGEYDDRFNAEFILRPGFQTLRFPFADFQTPSGRAINCRKIESLAFFTRRLERNVTVYLGDFRLVP